MNPLRAIFAKDGVEGIHNLDAPGSNLKFYSAMEYGTESPFIDLFGVKKAIGGAWKFSALDKNSVVLFEGGTDVNPSIYGQEANPFNQRPDVFRDRMEQAIYNRCVDVGAAMIGICRGSQLLCALNGGELVQDCDMHGFTHNMATNTGENMMVSSTHHQMMNPFDLPKENYLLLGWAEPKRSTFYSGTDKNDKIEMPLEPEVIWFPKTRSLCIQGHPEYMKGPANPFVLYTKRIIRQFIIGTSNGKS